MICIELENPRLTGCLGPIIPALRRLRPGGLPWFQVSLGYKVRPYTKTKNQKEEEEGKEEEGRKEERGEGGQRKGGGRVCFNYFP